MLCAVAVVPVFQAFSDLVDRYLGSPLGEKDLGYRPIGDLEEVDRLVVRISVAGADGGVQLNNQSPLPFIRPVFALVS